MNDFFELGVRLPGRATPHDEHPLDIGIEQALAQHSLADHPGRAKENHFHREALNVVRGRRDALIAQIHFAVSASVRRVDHRLIEQFQAGHRALAVAEGLREIRSAQLSDRGDRPII